MTIPILIISPNKDFGNLILGSLQESGAYAPYLAVTGPEAMELRNSLSPAACVLDVDFDQAPLKMFIEALRSLDENIKIVLIPSEKGKDEDILASLEADAYLGQPFYLPDLLEQLERLVPFDTSPEPDSAVESAAPPLPEKTKGEPRPDIPPAPEWLHDVSLAAQHLTRLSLQSASQAALITREDDIWAFAGELPQPAVQELAESVSEYWDDEGSDLARFVQLEETETEHMLYATSLGGEFVLALIFDSATPFSQIRSQAGQLARTLSAPLDQQTGDIILDDSLDMPSGVAQPLLEDVPPSIPEDWTPESSPSPAREDISDKYASEPITPEDLEKLGAVAFEEESGEYIETDPAHPQADTVPNLPKTFGKVLADSTVSSPGIVGDEIKVEPVSPALYNLTYACVLIPRFPEHHLTGALAAHLSDWITQVCVAFGWRLEHLSIRPDYLQWIVNLPPSSSPGHLMRIVRQHTSRRMFAQFSQFEEDNPSGDFWAPGYFILSTNQPPPGHLINEFIHQTRQRQGLYLGR